jgi:hypothetical protein
MAPPPHLFVSRTMITSFLRASDLGEERKETIDQKTQLQTGRTDRYLVSTQQAPQTSFFLSVPSAARRACPLLHLSSFAGADDRRSAGARVCVRSPIRSERSHLTFQNRSAPRSCM